MIQYENFNEISVGFSVLTSGVLERLPFLDNISCIYRCTINLSQSVCAILSITHLIEDLLSLIHAIRFKSPCFLKSAILCSISSYNSTIYIAKQQNLSSISFSNWMNNTSNTYYLIFPSGNHKQFFIENYISNDLFLVASTTFV